MGYEVITRNYLLPQRLFAMTRLVASLHPVPKRELLDMVQPQVIWEGTGSQEQSERLMATALRCGLVSEAQDKEKSITLAIKSEALESFATFRYEMQMRLLSVTAETEDHFLLNQVAAWYAVQDQSVLGFSKQAVEARFNEQLYPGAEERVLSEHPGLTAWYSWADFLGWGWPLQLGSRRESQFVPDATLRLAPIVSELIPEMSHEIPFGGVMSRLAKLCPELDDGVLFNQCWQASRGNEDRGNRLSLMLSTGLRTLHSQGKIELVDRKDAESWELFPSQSHINSVSHICRKVAA